MPWYLAKHWDNSPLPVPIRQQEVKH